MFTSESLSFSFCSQGSPCGIPALSFSCSRNFRDWRRCGPLLLKKSEDDYEGKGRGQCVHSTCRKAYLPSYMVKKIITGGSGWRSAVPLPRDPSITEVALLPENKVVEPVKADDRLLIFWLPVAIDVGLLNDGFVGVGVSLDDCRVCSCHSCSIAFPDFSPFSDPLIDHETFLLYGFQPIRSANRGRRATDMEWWTR